MIDVSGSRTEKMMLGCDIQATLPNPDPRQT
jgi:hypothetical protein